MLDQDAPGHGRPKIAFGALDAGIVVLTLTTAAIHLMVGAQSGRIPLLLNGLGYLALLVAFYASAVRCLHHHRKVGWALLGYTVLTVLLWLPRGDRNEVAYLDKLIELLLVGLLWLALRRAAAALRRHEAASVAATAAGAAGATGATGTATTALGVLLAVTLVGGLIPATADAQTRSPEVVARAWVDALNRADTEGAIGLYADNAVIVALGQEFRGKPAVAQRQRSTIGPVLFPSLTIQDLAVSGDTVRLQLRGENAITRMDGHGPVANTITLTVTNGLIVREEGPILSPADLAWYREAAPRFQAALRQARPDGLGQLAPSLPRTGAGAMLDGRIGMILPWIVALLIPTGLAMVLRSRWATPVAAPERRQ